jgi:hypothetical protein
MFIAKNLILCAAVAAMYLVADVQGQESHEIVTTNKYVLDGLPYCILHLITLQVWVWNCENICKRPFQTLTSILGQPTIIENGSTISSGTVSGPVVDAIA